MTAPTSETKKRSLPCRALLIIINLCFVIAGIFIIVYAIKLNSSGSLVVFKDGIPHIQFLFVGMILLGCTVILVAGIGCAGASYQRKGLLNCYNTFVVLAILFSFLVMAASLVSMGVAKGMSVKPYPAADQEPAVADGFNQAYCYAEGAYICTALPAGDVLEALVPGQVPDGIASSLQGYEGLNDICNSPGGGFVLNTLILEGQTKNVLETVCNECSNLKQYEQYEAAYSWVDRQCSLTEAGLEVISWCQTFLFQGKKGDTFDGSPYQACRPQALSLWSMTSKNIAIGMCICLVFLIVVIILVFIVTRRRSNAAAMQQDETNSGEGVKVVRGESIQSDEEYQQQSTPSGVTLY